MKFDNLSMFHPWNVNVPKIRVGENRDGGYVMLNNLFGATCMIGYGVDVNVAFDNDFISKFNVPAYIFDHTVQPPENLNPKIIFTPEGISTKDEAPLFTLATHVKRFVPDGEQFILKMDVEGAEWDVFRTADLTRVTQLIAEIHDLEKAPIDVIKLLNEKFYLVHIHGNNYPKQPYVNIDRVRKMPTVLECTWVRKDLVSGATLSNESYPTNLDFKNDSESPELELNFWKSVERPITFVAPDKEQKDNLEKFKTPEDQVVDDIQEAKHSRVFILKPGDHVPYEIIMGIDSVNQEGSFLFPIISNGIVSQDVRFINGHGPMMNIQMPIFNFKKFDGV
jgi:hypothetical protein